MPPVSNARIASYHAHVYFDGPGERALALAMRDEIAGRFEVALGRVHDLPVGPHARAMYQVSFATTVFAAFVPWLMLNRRGLSVLVHPNTDSERADHVTHALWLGAPLPLVNIGSLRETNEAEGPRPPNTQPTLAP